MQSRVVVAMGVLAVCACAASGAHAAPSAKLHASLSPKRLGGGTTIGFGFSLGDSTGTLPPALTGLGVRLPAGMAIDTSGLGTCRAAQLAHGPRGCSRDSLVGGGSVKVEVPLGAVIRPETAVLSVFNGAPENGRTTLLFYAVGRLPIATRLIFPGVIVPRPTGDTIEVSIPLIPTLPEAPDAAIVAMSSTLGTRQFVYYRTVAHRQVRVWPRGATVPPRCPAGGFAFSSAFSFNDASTTDAATTVACPL
jgi:hypothetical protein